jgi:hypothetical protein
MKAYGGSGIIAPLILDLGTRWRFTARPLFPPGKEPLVSIELGGWMGLRAALDAVMKR